MGCSFCRWIDCRGSIIDNYFRPPNGFRGYLMTMKVLNIIVIALAVIAASVFASRIPPMWEEFSIAVFVLALAIFYQRKSLKKEIMEARSEGEGYTLEAFEKFSSELEKALNLVLEKDFHDEEKTASVLEEWIERISKDLP